MHVTANENMSNIISTHQFGNNSHISQKIVYARRIQKRRNCNGNALNTVADHMAYIKESHDMVWYTWTEETETILGIIRAFWGGVGNSREMQLCMETSKKK